MTQSAALQYFCLLPTELRLYFASSYLDSRYNTIWRRLPNFNYLDSNYNHEDVIEIAIQHNYPRIVISLIQASNLFNNSNIVTIYRYAIKYNCVALIRWLLSNHSALDVRKLVELAPSPDAVTLIRELLNKAKGKSDGIIHVLIRSGDVAALSGISINRLERNHYVEAAIASDSSDMFRLIVDSSLIDSHGKPIRCVDKVIHFDVITEIVKQGKFNVLRCALEHYHWPIDSQHLATAFQLDSAIAMRRQIIDLLLTYHPQLLQVEQTNQTLVMLVAAGDLDLLKQMTVNNPNDLYHAAVRHGQLDILMYLRQQYPLQFEPRKLIRAAIEANQLAIAQYCYNNCDSALLISHYFHCALSCGNLAMVQWLHQLGCPIKYELLYSVRTSQDSDVALLEFLHQNYPKFMLPEITEDFNPKMISCYSAVGTSGKISKECCHWLHQHGLLRGKLSAGCAAYLAEIQFVPQEKYQLKKDYSRYAIEALVSTCNVTALTWMIQHSDLRQTIDSYMVECIVRRGMLTILKLLWPVSVVPSRLLRCARAARALDIIEWVQQMKLKKSKRLMKQDNADGKRRKISVDQ